MVERNVEKRLILFVQDIIKRKKLNFISPEDLKQEIRAAFGLDERTIKRYLIALESFGFIRYDLSGEYELILPKEIEEGD